MGVREIITLMKMYVTSRFKDATTHKDDIEHLCRAVKTAGYDDFSFIRDIEQFNPHHFATQQEVWQASLDSLRQCDALLIDVSDQPSGGRNVEVGMAYALGMPIFVIVRRGTPYKSFYDGVATKVIVYNTIDDIVSELPKS